MVYICPYPCLQPSSPSGLNLCCRCLSVLFSLPKLSSWLLSGQLLDPYGEFFLSRRVCPFLTFSSFSSSSSRFLQPSSSAPSFFCTSTSRVSTKSRPKNKKKDKERHHSALSSSSSTLPKPDSLRETYSTFRPLFPSPSSASMPPFLSGSSLFASGDSFLYEDLTQPLSPQRLCYEWEHMFTVNLSRLPVCCFPHAKTPLFRSTLFGGGGKSSSLLSSSSLALLAASSSFSTSNSWEVATAATTAAFVGKTVRVLTRSGRWSQHHMQQLRPIIAKMVGSWTLICTTYTRVLYACM